MSLVWIFALLSCAVSAWAAAPAASSAAASPDVYPHELPEDRPLSRIMNNVSGQLVHKAEREKFSLAQKFGKKGWFTLDLSHAFNHNTVKWMPGQTLARLTPGDRHDYGVPFIIADPKGGNCIMLRSDRFAHAPQSVTVSVNRKASVLYFLHACAYAKWGDSREYVVKYHDGSHTAIEILPAGSMTGQSENIQDWYSGNNLVDKPGARFVALADPQHPSRLDLIRYIYVLEWVNPHPDKTIQSITFNGGKGDSTLFIFAVTGHE